MSDRNLILSIYGDTNAQHWVTLPNYQFNMLYWGTIKRSLQNLYLKPMVLHTKFYGSYYLGYWYKLLVCNTLGFWIQILYPYFLATQ
jgi:hypothetical protein